MRVGLVIGQLSVGGAEGQLSELVAGLDRARIAPVVYSLADAPAQACARLVERGAEVRVIGGHGWSRVRRLRDALLADRVELIHSWLFIANGYAFAARLLGARLPLVTAARNCKSQGALLHSVNVAAFRASARVIANSEEVRSYVLRRYLAPAGRVSVVYNGVDAGRFRPATGAGELTVVTAGRFVRQKNPALFVELAAQIHRELPEVRFAMLGDGPLRAETIARARAAGLAAQIDFPGECGDVERFFAGAALFVLTSWWEGLPNVVLEAMACGLPVVASDVGGTREIVQAGRSGFLVRAGVLQDFAHYTRALLRDPELRAEMGGRARRRAEQFSVARMVADTEAVYREALAA